ncbi:MAG: rhodanese-like domain-containing protein [Oscillospiraceae bacterium]|jgi:phage shock protein E|nr:rhodanese-like domain-containing protein [Oscillospiraceae bacterium]
MGFFDFLRGSNINQEVKEFQETSDAVLLDVRTPQEYQDGHIPGSVNAPLQTLGSEDSLPADRDTPLFVYCHSGARSSQAVSLLTRMGYTNAKNIGGIAAYTGKVER